MPPFNIPLAVRSQSDFLNLFPDSELVLSANSNSFTDFSPSQYALTNTGVTLDDTTTRYGAKSFRFPNNGNLAGTINSNFMNNDWMFSSEVRWSSGSGFKLIFAIRHPAKTENSINYGAKRLAVYFESSGNIVVAHNTAIYTTIAAGFSQNTWHNLSFGKNGSTYYFFRNGILLNSISIHPDFTGFAPTATLSLGTDLGNLSQSFVGKMDDIHIQSISPPTDDFTPPSQPLFNP